MLQLITAPAVEPCTKAEVSVEGRITIAAEQTRLESYIAPARQDIERLTGRALCTQTWDLTLPRFPLADADGLSRIVLPYPPVASVTSLTYVASDGTSTTLATTQYALVAPSGDFGAPGWIELKYGCSWPDIRGGTSAQVIVRFVCGYGVASFVPKPLKLAVMRRAVELYEGREMDAITKSLIEPFIVWSVA